MPCPGVTRQGVQLLDRRRLPVRREGFAQPVTHRAKRRQVPLLRTLRLLLQAEGAEDQPQHVDVVQMLRRVVENVPGVRQSDGEGDRVSFVREDHLYFSPESV